MPTATKHSSTRKKPITEIGQTVPSNFKFGIIVAVALFWTEFVRSLLNSLFGLVHISLPFLTDFLLAVVVTVLAFFVLMAYRRIKARLKRLTV